MYCLVQILRRNIYRVLVYNLSIQIESFILIDISSFLYSIYNHRTTKTNQKYPSVNL